MGNDTWLHKIRNRQYDLQSGNASADSSVQARPKKRLHEAKPATNHTWRKILRIPFPKHKGIDQERLKEFLAKDLLHRQYSIEISQDVLLLETPVPLSYTHVRDIKTQETLRRIENENRVLKLLPNTDIYDSQFSQKGFARGSFTIFRGVTGGNQSIVIDNETMVIKDLRPHGQDMELCDERRYHVVQTSQGRSIFASLLTSMRRSPHGPQAELIAIKSYTVSSSELSEFYSLNDRLCKINQLQHPNMVETISAFLKDAHNHLHEANFVFPWALCNLRQLFLEPSLSSSSGIQATQLEAMASALAYLHEVLRIAHRSIRASNILVYHVPGSSELVLKLASFSSSVDVVDILELRERPEIDSESIWTLDTILANDVLMLGCVFVELVAYMVEGPRGVEALPRSRSGATISDVLYSEWRGEIFVGILVFDWMTNCSKSSPFARLSFSIIETMLRRLPQQRMTARQVCEAFIKSLDPHLFTPCHEFSDDHRNFTFTSASQCEQPNWVDKIRAGLESKFESPIDWSPLPPVNYACSEDRMRVSWKYGSHQLSKIISHASARQLMDMCRAFLSSGLPILPTTQPPRKNDQTALDHELPDGGNNARVLESTGSRDIELTEQKSKEIYLCVDKILVEFPETQMCLIANIHNLPDDEALFVKMREQLRNCNSWFKNMLSWKTCTRLKFVKFAVVKDRRVKPLGLGRPIGHAEYEYKQSNHQAEHLDAYLDMIAEEVLRGIHDTGTGKDETHLTDEIPKKRNPPQLLEVRGTEAYGLHAMQGLSLRRVCWWTAVSYTLGLAFVVFWLSFVDKLDLQNAFMPVTFLAAMLVGALATTQVLV